MPKLESSEIRELRKILDGITSHVKNTVAQCIAAGKLLTKIKENSKYGDWNEILESVGLHRQTATRYMLLWEHRSELDLKQIKTLSDASKMISEVCEKEPRQSVEGFDIPRSQNQPLTKKQTPTLAVQKRQVFRAQEEADSNKTPHPKTNGEIRLDKTGYPIPENLISEWDRATEQAMGWIRAFDAIHRQVIAVHGTDFAVAKINKSSLEADHSNYRGWLKQAVPYAVCATCQGRIPDKCKACNPCNEEGKGVGLGWVNQRFWESCVPIELRKIREKSYGTNSSARLSA